MAVTNMSIIEKDDLIKKMPRDSLKEELRNPSGNFPLFLIAARLKEVEEMERDVMARQAAQQSSTEAETVAARLAQQAMPQVPMSGVGANPAPQPRPDAQGIMAQQMAGPTQPLPTVMAQRGLQGKYPGESSGIDQEVLAAAVRSRQAKGGPRLYNQQRAIGFEKAGRKGAAPASQIPALLGLASAMAKTEERAFGGMETLPPFQIESSSMPMSRKGFTAPARSVGSKMPKEEDGLAYISKILGAMGGSSKDKPTVFAQEGFSSLSAQRRPGETRRQLQARLEGRPDPGPDSTVLDKIGSVVSSFVPTREQVLANQRVGVSAASMGPTAFVEQAQTPVPVSANQAAQARQLLGNFTRDELFAVNPMSFTGASQEEIDEANRLALQQGREGQARPLSQTSNQTDASDDQTLEAVQIDEVPTLSSIGEKFGKLISDPNEQFKPIIAEYTKQVEEVEKQEPVPKSMTDMRERYQNRLDALEKSPLPFMTAAAAAIRGNQPILVAMTNAMIGYSAGDEKVKNQGLKIMGDMVDLDVNIKTLEAKQRDSEMKARNALLEARQAALKGNRERETQLLQLASNEQRSLRTAAADKAKLEDAARNRANQLKIGTFKTQAEIDRFNTLLAARKEQFPNEGEFNRNAAVLAAMSPRSQTSSFSALNFERATIKGRDKFLNEDIKSLIDQYNRGKSREDRVPRQGASDAQLRAVIEAAGGRSALPGDRFIQDAILQKLYGNTPARSGGGVATGAMTLGELRERAAGTPVGQ